MRITIEKAVAAASKMTKKYRDEVKEIKVKVSAIVTKEYEKQLPKEVLDCYKDFKGYFETTERIYVVGKGLNSDEINLIERLPKKPTNTWSTTISLSDEVASIIAPMLEKANDIDHKSDRKEREIKGVLLALRTYKNVLDQFPEAAEYLDVKSVENRNLPVNLSELRKEFSKEA
jgi:hypothetical protein